VVQNSRLVQQIYCIDSVAFFLWKSPLQKGGQNTNGAGGDGTIYSYRAVNVRNCPWPPSKNEPSASGAFASGSEVVRAGLGALRERDGAVERWLREEVAATYDAMQADPARALPAKAVFDEIRARHAARLKDGE
jgi:antitoxin ParD1/3/4